MIHVNSADSDQEHSYYNVCRGVVKKEFLVIIQG